MIYPPLLRSLSMRSSCGFDAPNPSAECSLTMAAIWYQHWLIAFMYWFSIVTYGDAIAAPVVGCFARNPNSLIASSHYIHLATAMAYCFTS